MFNQMIFFLLWYSYCIHHPFGRRCVKEFVPQTPLAILANLRQLHDDIAKGGNGIGPKVVRRQMFEPSTPPENQLLEPQNWKIGSCFPFSNGGIVRFHVSFSEAQRCKFLLLRSILQGTNKSPTSRHFLV